MPELPEVETIARGLANRVTGDVIESVWLGSKPQPLKSTAAEIVETLESQRVAGVRRVGKHIVFDLTMGAGALARPAANAAAGQAIPEKAADRSVRPTQQQPGTQWIVHLGMSGRMLVCEPGAEIEKHTHDRQAEFGKGIAVRRSAAVWAIECDPRIRGRRFGTSGNEVGRFCSPLSWS